VVFCKRNTVLARNCTSTHQAKAIPQLEEGMIDELVLWTGESIFCMYCSHSVEHHFTKILSNGERIIGCNCIQNNSTCKCIGFTPYTKEDLKKN